MLNYIETEFMKLKRRKLIFLAMFISIAIPIVNMLHKFILPKNSSMYRTFSAFNKFDFTQWFLLPCVLTMIALIIFYSEQENSTMRQLVVLPVNKPLFILSKFTVILLFSVIFMLLTAGATIAAGYIIGYSDMTTLQLIRFIKLCLIAAVVIMLSMAPIFSIIIIVKKDYILPTCAMLIYCFSGAIFGGQLKEIHPLASSAMVIQSGGSRYISGDLINIVGTFCVFTLISILVMKKQEW